MSARGKAFALVLAAAAVAGCKRGPQSDGQIGGEEQTGDGCKTLSSEVLRVDEASPLGFSAAEVLAAAGATPTGTLTWAKGGSTALELRLDAPTAVRFARRAPASDGGLEPAPAACPDQLEIELPLGFSTADGAFAETLPITLAATARDAARFFHELDLEALAGTYELTELDPASYDAVHVYLDGELAAGALHGAIDAVGESVDNESGPDGTASAQRVEIASY